MMLTLLAFKTRARSLRPFAPFNFGSPARSQNGLRVGREDAVEQRSKKPGLSKVMKFVGGGVKQDSKTAAAAAIKVVTDIDDTIVSSGGVKFFGIALGGIDNLYRRGQFYPGAVQFLFELSRPAGVPLYSKLSYNDSSLSSYRTSSSSSSSPFIRLPSRVAVLTARAREFKFALALKSSHKVSKMFTQIGNLNGLPGWGIGDVYYGSVAEWIFQQRKGLRKFKNFKRMIENDDKLDTENGVASGKKRQYIMVGDTGEKDEEAAERIANLFPDRLRAVFLRQVFTMPTSSSSTSSQSQVSSSVEPVMKKDRKVNGVPFYYFRTYIGAAVKAQRTGILSDNAVQRIAEQAVKDLRDLDDHLPAGSKSTDQKAKATKRKESLLGLLYKEVQEAQSLRWQEIEKDAKAVASLKVKVRA